MAEYISKEFMLKNLEADKMNNAEHCEPVTVQIMERFIRYVKEFPSADVQAIKRGRWEKDEKRNSFEKFCSICKHEAYWDTDYGQQLFDYCPYCGARMIKDGDEE